MSFGGLVALGILGVGLGIAACGVGLLLRKPWASELAPTLSRAYIGLITVHFVWPLIFVISNGGGSALPTLLVGIEIGIIPPLITPAFVVFKLNQ